MLNRRVAVVGILVAILSPVSLPAAAQSNAGAMLGKWTGTWPKGPSQTIQIDKIDPDWTMHGKVEWGAWRGRPGGSVNVNHMKIPDGTFTLHDSKGSAARSEWVFKDGAFQGTRFEDSSGKPTNHLTLERVAN